MRRLVVGLGGLLLGPGLAGCGSSEEGAVPAESVSASVSASVSGDPDSTAADRSVCQADAQQVGAPPADAFPAEWSFPPDTTLYDAEQRADVGTILTAVSSAPFDDVLEFLNTDAVDAGFEVVEGETEEDDAEASWSSTDFTGRWTIRKSGDCPGETVIQVLAVPAA